MRLLKYKSGRAEEILATNKYVSTNRMLIHTELTRKMADYQTGSYSFRVLLCYSGCGTIISIEDDFCLPFFKGDCIFVPANSIPMKIHGEAELLSILC